MSVSLPCNTILQLPELEEGGATSRDFSLIYRAPELWDQPHFVPTPESDVFSLAIVCYEVRAFSGCLAKRFDQQKYGRLAPSARLR